MDKHEEGGVIPTDAEQLARVLKFDPERPVTKIRTRLFQPKEAKQPEPAVAAVVTVTRFIGGERVHAQVPIFANQIIGDAMRAADLKLTPELSELLADGAVEANSYLDRVAATIAARPLGDYHA